MPDDCARLRELGITELAKKMLIRRAGADTVLGPASAEACFRAAEAFANIREHRWATLEAKEKQDA